MTGDPRPPTPGPRIDILFVRNIGVRSVSHIACQCEFRNPGRLFVEAGYRCLLERVLRRDKLARSCWRRATLAGPGAIFYARTEVERDTSVSYLADLFNL